MPTMFRFQYRFHPAGQGIFASGKVTEVDPLSPPFHWVFDCGSVSKAATLIPAVRRYKDLILGDFLDLLCISHFDADHVNGLGELLTGLHVGTVVLPYCSSLERLIVGSRTPSRDDDYFQFLGNPVAYLLERAVSIQRIIIVGGPEDLPPLGPQDRPPNIDNPGEPPKRESWEFKPLDKPLELPAKAAEAVCDAATLKAAAAGQTEVWPVPSSFPALVFPANRTANWEFLFYHKPIDPAAIAAIRQRVATVLQSILEFNVTEILGNETHRKRIKNAYVTGLKNSGQTHEDINSTSLCVYSGPQLDHLNGSEITPPWPHPLIGAAQAPWLGHYGYPDICSVLYTGDTNLKPAVNRQDLRGFLTLPRWDQICILQVPHHGSRENWEVGSAQEFQHFYSVFCADENHRKYRHPSREVFLDLLLRGPILANKVHGWSWQGAAYFR